MDIVFHLRGHPPGEVPSASLVLIMARHP